MGGCGDRFASGKIRVTLKRCFGLSGFGFMMHKAPKEAFIGHGWLGIKLSREVRSKTNGNKRREDEHYRGRKAQMYLLLLYKI